MKNRARWRRLVAKLKKVSRELDGRLAAKPEDDAISTMARAFFRKGLDTLCGIDVLYRESLPTQAQALIRVLLEVRMDIEIFLERVSQNPAEAGRRVLDAMMLEKIKQQRQSDFRGHELVEGAPPPEFYLQLEKDLIARYGITKVKAMRRYGFSGLSVEDRAKELGLSDLYNVVYRNFSRNIHGTDYSENLRAQGIASDQWLEYEDLRDDVALSTAVRCGLQMAALVNGVFGCGLDDELMDVWLSCIRFENWVEVPAGRTDYFRQ